MSEEVKEVDASVHSGTESQNEEKIQTPTTLKTFSLMTMKKKRLMNQSTRSKSLLSTLLMLKPKLVVKKMKMMKTKMN